MNAVMALARKDFTVVYRDRFLVFIAAYALILAAVTRWGVSFIPVDHLDLYLAPGIVLVGTLLLGTVLGFSLIEEREQGTWLLLRILPLGQGTLHLYLVATASVLSIAISLLAAAIYAYPVADWPLYLFMLASSGLAAPLMMLALGALARNKIEGLAVSKILSAVGFLPALIFLVPVPWQLLAAWCPFYWLYLGLLQGLRERPHGGRCALLARLSDLGAGDRLDRAVADRHHPAPAPLHAAREVGRTHARARMTSLLQ